MRFGGGKNAGGCMLRAGELSVFQVVRRFRADSVRLGSPLRRRFGRPIKKFQSLDRAFTDGSEGCDAQLPTPPGLERLSATSRRKMTLYPGIVQYSKRDVFNPPNFVQKVLGYDLIFPV